MNRKAIFAVAMVAVLAGLVLGLRWCSPRPPNYNQAGNDGGERPRVIDSDVTVVINPTGSSFNNAELTGLVCGTLYTLAATGSETNINCTGYDFAYLADRVMLPMEIRLGQLQCQDDCAPKRSRLSYLKYDCRATRATVQAKYEVQCPRPSDAAMAAGLNYQAIPTTAPSENKAPGETGNMDPPTRRGELNTDVRVSTNPMDWILPCPAKRVLSFRYEEFSYGGCDSIDFKPFVDRAEARIDTLFYGAYQCGTGCTKSKRILRREWRCDAATSRAVVIVWFEVECKR